MSTIAGRTAGCPLHMLSQWPAAVTTMEDPLTREPPLSEEQHLYYHGSLFPNSTLIPVTIICLLLFIVGVTGNTMTILIIQRFKDMKTTTNLYLSSMAVSDLVIFLSLPFHLYRLWRYVPWIFGGLLCRLLHYINEGCTYATILHITALSVERYLAICFPLKAKALVTKRRVRYVILALWAFALLSAAPMLVLVGVEYDNNTHPDYSTRQCKHTSYGVSSGLLHTMIWVSTVYFFFPMLCLTFLYGSIGRKLWKSRHDLRGPSASGRERSHRQTVRILAVVVLAFAVCWLPFHIGRNLFTHSDDYSEAQLSQNFNVASMVLFYLSASINPVLYNLMSRKYRAAVRRLLPWAAEAPPTSPAPSRGGRRLETVSLALGRPSRLFSEASDGGKTYTVTVTDLNV